MSNELQLLTTREFNGHVLDCYVDPEQEDKSEFWATREQIGRLLGYRHPRKAIKDIHLRNKERLDMFSKTVELPKLFNGAQVEPTFRNEPIATVYNFKGLLEICRYSNQPNANAVIDVLWDIADEIRRTGMYIADKAAFAEMIERCLVLERKVDAMERQLQQEHSFSVLGHTVSASSKCITFKDAASFLSQHGVEMGQNRLYKHCRDKKLLCSRRGRQWNRPTQKALERGLFNVEFNGGLNVITLITPQGLKHLTDEFMAEKYPLLMLIDGGGNFPTTIERSNYERDYQ